MIVNFQEQMCLLYVQAATLKPKFGVSHIMQSLGIKADLARCMIINSIDEGFVKECPDDPDKFEFIGDQISGN